MSRLALGTVQFGMPYGISNKNGQIKIEEAEAIINCARGHRIDTLDTAIGYGGSESCLGKIGVQDFNVVTKLPAVSNDVPDVKSWVFEQVEASLKRLKLGKLYAILLHQPEQLIDPISGQALAEALMALKSQGYAKKIGVSVYKPEDLIKVSAVIDPDLIQAPFNLLDRRLASSEWFYSLKKQGVEIHARSVFLQGLLLMPRQEIPQSFERWSGVWNAYHEFLTNKHICATAACLHFAFSHPQIDKIVVGVENRSQLQELIDQAREARVQDWPNVSCDDEALINPSKWNKN
jgi:aryl-alcohol dehydrogenase-like predicted oxidoreductase